MSKTKEPRAHDVEVMAAKGIYETARQDADQEMARLRGEMEAVRVESQAAGALQAIETTIAFQEFMKVVTLHRIKQSKEYKQGGLTWAEFCESLGMTRPTVDRMLDDINPIVESFSSNMSNFCGMPFSKIRLLGKQVSLNLSKIEDNCLVYGDESIPLTPEYRDEVQALIERIGEEAKTAREESEATVRAKDKVLKSKEEVIRKQEKDLARYEKTVAAKGLTPEEDSLLGKIDELGIILNGHCLQMENVMDAMRQQAVHSDPFPNVIAAFIALMDNVRMRTGAYRDTVVTELAPAGMLPEEEWSPKM